MTATTGTISRLLRISGWLELSLGIGHTVVGTLILIRPKAAAPIVSAFGWPNALLVPFAVPPAQYDLVLAMSLSAGTAWMIFGAILIRLGRTRPASRHDPMLALVLLQQASLALLMVLYVRWHVLAVADSPVKRA
jgi:hypothetical protein